MSYYSQNQVQKVQLFFATVSVILQSFCNDYIYFKLHNYVCLLNCRLLLAALVHFSCILIGQFRFRFFVLLRNSESAIFVAMFLVHASSGGRLFCMAVAVW